MLEKHGTLTLLVVALAVLACGRRPMPARRATPAIPTPLLTVTLVVPTPEPPVQEPPATPVPAATLIPTTDAPGPPADALTSAPTLGIGSTRVREKDGMVMMYVPGGTFQMGSEAEDAEAFDMEFPRHPVTLDAFWMDQTEVANGQYRRCVEAAVCEPPSENRSRTHETYYGDNQYDAYPVLYVSWYDADRYCRWAGGRLPAEAEWEYAARGPDSLTYPWGNDPPDDTLLNYAINMGDTSKVGSYPDGASWCGVLDMAGNVWEWVTDTYAADYYAASPASNPTGPDIGIFKVLRGGSWDWLQGYVRAASRYAVHPDYRYLDIGFRCVVGSGD